jgi:predicted HTH transcriptional regulator
MNYSSNISDEEKKALLDELVQQPKEAEWIEFKLNNSDPDEIGNNISALSNSATLCEKEKAYLVYGVEDKTQKIVGTNFDPDNKKIGSEELENWLGVLLNPSINFNIYRFEYSPNVWVVIFEIDQAIGYPVSFKKRSYIRVGSYTKPLFDHRGKEKALWAKLEKKVFEKGISRAKLTEDQVLDLIDYPNIFKKLSLSLPSNKQQIIEKLIQEEIIVLSRGKYNITNLGAILFSNKLSEFTPLGRKAVRVILYRGANKMETLRETKIDKGYAVGIDNIVEFIKNVTPEREVIEGTTRRKITSYPEIAIRELVVNALIHQDFTISGAGPMIEIFDNRIEFSNPGAPLVDIQRIIDHSPRSRNEKLAGLMARMNICEERGSGADKVVISCELQQLPAPYFQKEENDFTRVTIFTHRILRDMSREDRIRATYFHAVIKYLSKGYMTNQSLRQRFGIADENYPTASIIIRMSLEAHLIKTRDQDSATKYVPFWA